MTIRLIEDDLRATAAEARENGRFGVAAELADLVAAVRKHVDGRVWERSGNREELCYVEIEGVQVAEEDWCDDCRLRLALECLDASVVALDEGRHHAAQSDTGG